MTISEEQFQAFVDVRDSGVTNMYAVDTVIEEASYSGATLTRDDCIYIMKNSGDLSLEYGIG